MLKEEKNPEMSRQFEEIYNDWHNPDIQERKKQKLKKEKRLKETEEDLGI